jgi:hypothetical protein
MHPQSTFFPSGEGTSFRPTQKPGKVITVFTLSFINKETDKYAYGVTMLWPPFSFSTNGQIFMKFGMDVMPLEDTPTT